MEPNKILDSRVKEVRPHIFLILSVLLILSTLLRIGCHTQLRDIRIHLVYELSSTVWFFKNSYVLLKQKDINSSDYIKVVSKALLLSPLNLHRFPHKHMLSGVWIPFRLCFLEPKIHWQEHVCQMQIFDLKVGFSKIFCVCFAGDYLWDGSGTYLLKIN